MGTASLYDIVATGITATASTRFTMPGSINPTSNPVTTAQWHYAGRQNNYYPSSGFSSDWIFSIVSTDKKETVACGWGANSEEFHGGTIFKLDHSGNLVWNTNVLTSNQHLVYPTSVTIYDQGKNDLWSVAKASDGYVAVGRGNHGLLIVEVDENGNFINGTPIDLVPGPLYSNPASWLISIPVAEGFAVAVDPTTNSVQNIVVGGTISDHASSVLAGGLWVINYTGGSWEVSSSYYGGGGGSSINKILTKPKTTGTGYNIYACGEISEPGDNATYSWINANPTSGTVSNAANITTYNKDIWILSTDNTLASVSSDQYSKENIYVNTTAGPEAINTSYTDPQIYPYQEFGPLTARNMSPSPEYYLNWTDNFGVVWQSPITVYINAYNNQCAAAYDMTFTDDNKLAVISMVNIIGINPKSLNATPGGIVRSGTGFYGSPAPNFAEYIDGDAFLLKIEPASIGGGTSPTSLLGAENVGHFSGTDMFLQVREDLENNFIIAGSTADHYGSSDYNLPDAPGYGLDMAYIVSVDNTFSNTGDLWRRSFLASDSRATDGGTAGTTGGGTGNNSDDMMCVFAMDVTADGGYIIAGNNGKDGDDYTVTKFASPYEESLIASNGYTTFGEAGIPDVYTVSSSETWPNANVPDGSNIASKVVVPAGATLTINAGTFNFAASDQLWDYTSAPGNYTTAGGTIGCGILVQPGGTLNINGAATLQGISISGVEHNMWDGIVVEGTYGEPSPSAYQGAAYLAGATIKDARCGVYVADNYRSYYHNYTAPVNIATTDGNTSGWNYTSSYNGTYNMGGGILNAYGSNFYDCYYSTDFQNYFYPSTNPSIISNCIFNTAATGLGDICNYTDANGALIPANTYIAEWQWNSLAVRQNSFSCDLSFPIAERPIGVMASGGSGVTISNDGTDVISFGNVFSNLSYGVVAEGGCFSYPVIIAYNTFDNNNFGVNASSVTPNSLFIQYNSFLTPWYTSGDFTPTGVTLAGCHGYNVSQNSFDRCSTCTSTPLSWNISLVDNAAGTANEWIKYNTFDHTWNACVPTATNGSATAQTGLEFSCNTYNNNSFYDILRADDIIGNLCVINPNQGTCSGGASNAANNLFNYCWGTVSNIVANADVTEQVAYNHLTGYPYDPTGCDQTTDGTGTILINNDCFGYPSGVSPTTACPPQAHNRYRIADMTATLTTLTALDGEIAANTDPTVAITLQNQHDQLTSEIAGYYVVTGSYDSAAALLAGYNMYRDALPYYFTEGDYTDAQVMLTAMVSETPGNTADDSLYGWIMQKAINLYAEGQTWFNLDTASIDSMIGLVQYNSAAGYMAGGVLALIGAGMVTWPIPAIDSSFTYPPDISGGGDRKANPVPITNVNQTGQHTFSAYPNPTYGSLTITASGAGTFTLYTLLGQQLQDYPIATGQTEVQLPANLAAGIYVGEFKPTDGSAMQQVSLVYQP